MNAPKQHVQVFWGRCWLRMVRILKGQQKTWLSISAEMIVELDFPKSLTSNTKDLAGNPRERHMRLAKMESMLETLEVSS